jgi:hypothetical protein
LNTVTSGLDYVSISQDPARGVEVEVVDGAGAVLDSDVTDAAGAYSLTVTSDTDVRVRVRSVMTQTTGATWDIRAVDNTNGNAIYVLAGALATSGAADSVRNLNAASGWGGASYTTTRAAAPFAILDSAYEAITDIEAVDASVVFPAMQFMWSINNKAASGQVTDGDIGTSSFTTIGGVPTVLVLGDANSDTDEYDSHVVVHEFGHYFESELSRADSMGGPHSLSNRLDPRIALGEGFGNALSGIILDDPFYRDSSGASQASGFSINVEDNTNTNAGWFNEGSVQSILYDIYDSTDDGADVISAGFAPIYNALVAPDYTGDSDLTTIFLLANQIATDPAIAAADLTSLLAGQSIDGTGDTGVGETNDGSVVSSLPVYKTVTVGGPAVEVCSVDDAGTFNKLGNRALLSLSIATAGSRTITMTRTSGATARDPDFRIFQAGAVIASGLSATADTEQLVTTLAVGDYTIEALDDRNLSTANSGDACYDFTVQ